ncbi:MAG: hypothetical protein R8J85_07760 [Mariprofundales bacterium]
MKNIFIIVIIALFSITGEAMAADTSSAIDDNGAVIAGAATAGATVVGTGALAATASAATITSTLAAVGAGSMAIGIGVVAAVPIIAGGSAYMAYKWFTSDD